MFRPTRACKKTLLLRDYHPLWFIFPDNSNCSFYRTGLVRVRSPLLTESQLISFPPGTEMFQFPGFASRPYVFRTQYCLRSGFPHSEIDGSKVVRTSPSLIAAYHVFHRLLMPRHPPNALKTLNRTFTYSKICSLEIVYTPS